MRKLTLLLALVLLLAACGGSGGDNSSSAPTTTTVAEQTGEQMTDDTMADDQMTDDTMADDQMTDTMADDTMADDTMTDDTMADDEMTDDMSDDTMTDDQMTDDMSDDTMTDDQMTDDMSDDTMADDSMGHDATTFTVTITNHSDMSALATPLSPGAYFVHTAMDTLFAEGIEDRGEGLESLAEDGDPSALLADLSAMTTTVPSAAAFDTPDGASQPGPALPGDSYSFTFDAVPGDYLSFATMFIESNDWFFAPDPSGINLFPSGAAITGDVTDMIHLWDAGTEVDETPGEGPNQGPRQSGPNTGEAESVPIDTVAGYHGAVTVTITAG